MALVHRGKKEINAKIIYYGPAQVGKSASLRYVYDRIKPRLRGELRTVLSCGSPLLFFDFSPFEHPIFEDYQLRLHLYTLQGRVENPAAWKMVLKGADGLVIVGDASPAGEIDVRQSVVRLRDILGSYGIGLEDVPYVLQFNALDSAPWTNDGDTLGKLGLDSCPVCMASPENGKGILETLTMLSRQVMERTAQHLADAELESPGATIVNENTGKNAADVALAASPPSGAEERIAATADRGTAGSGRQIRVMVPTGDIRASEGSVKIPLEIVSPCGERQRLVVTVAVAAESS